jgi:hypothetical protein
MFDHLLNMDEADASASALDVDETAPLSETVEDEADAGAPAPDMDEAAEPALTCAPFDAARAPYTLTHIAGPGQILKAKFGAAELLRPVSPSSDPDLARAYAQAAVAPMLIGGPQAQMHSQLGLVETPECVQHVRALLTQFDHDFLSQAGQIRNMLVTQLIEKTQDRKPTTSLKAIELLGKVTEVGLFTEQVKFKDDGLSETELNAKISEKIARFTGVTTVRPRDVDANDIESVVEEVFSSVNQRKNKKK